ncbi:MAG: hypothetical protein ACYTEQ_26830 [Planctomycetota bacterium]|jgi:hypothetical protein
MSYCEGCAERDRELTTLRAEREKQEKVIHACRKALAAAGVDIVVDCGAGPATEGNDG